MVYELKKGNEVVRTLGEARRDRLIAHGYVWVNKPKPKKSKKKKEG